MATIDAHSQPMPLKDLLAHPIASTPLSDEVARILTERYGPAANPDDMVTLSCDDTPTLVEVARNSDAIVLTINAAARVGPLRSRDAGQSRRGAGALDRPRAGRRVARGVRASRPAARRDVPASAEKGRRC